MCLVFFGRERHPDYRLVLASNRDEFHHRPTTAAGFWADYPDVLAGQDLQAGGTWLGVTRTGRIAFLTCYRESSPLRELPSRGSLVGEFLCGEDPPQVYLDRIAPRDLNGYNLVVGDGRGLYYYSNRENIVRKLGAGWYGLSNHLLDTPWPKVAKGKTAFQAIVQRNIPGHEMADALFEMLSDKSRPADDLLPDTGVGLEKERFLAPVFISGDIYGTRSSTVILIDNNGEVTFWEQSYAGRGQPSSKLKYQFMIL